MHCLQDTGYLNGFMLMMTCFLLHEDFHLFSTTLDFFSYSLHACPNSIVFQNCVNGSLKSERNLLFNFYLRSLLIQQEYLTLSFRKILLFCYLTCDLQRVLAPWQRIKLNVL